MIAADTFKLVEAIGLIKSSKRHGCSPSVIAQQLKLASSDDIVDNLSDFRLLSPTLAAALEQSDSLIYDEQSQRFFFKFAQQFKSAYEFDVALKERSPVIIVDPDISFEGLLEYIEVRKVLFFFASAHSAPCCDCID